MTAMRFIKVKRKYLKSEKLNCRLVLTILNVCEITEEEGIEVVSFYQIFNVNDIWNFDRFPNIKEIEEPANSETKK
jgi:hypothetical protein